jgi:hypothetical protein
MGYELNKLMRQFGVSTPSVANYSGAAAPVAPLEPIKASENTVRTTSMPRSVVEDDAYDAAMVQYRNNLAAYETNKGPQQAAYLADRDAYDRYKNTYMGRVMNTPQYTDAQFQTTPSAAMNWVNSPIKDEATGRGIGLEQWQQNFRDNVAATPNATPAQLRASMDKYGVSGYDAAQARGGSMWGAPLAMPTYGASSASSSMGVPLTLPSNVNLNIGGDFSGVDFSKIDPAYFENLKNFNLSGAGLDMNPPQYQFVASKPARPYATGGAVRKFRFGGAEGESEDPMEAFLRERNLVNSDQEMPAPAVMAEPAGLAPMPVQNALVAAPTSPMVNVMGGDRNAQLMGMLSKYFPQGDEYGAELKAAREANTRESAAFQKMLQDAIKQPKDSGPSKSEMYFRLAAAFGAPTKTGHFAESLAKVGEASAGIAKERRESSSAERARQLALGLEAQKLRMAGAKEDLTTLRQLASEGMKDKRTIATELIKEYVKSGQPQSSAGKQALDEGLRPGTPEYQKRVGQIAELNVDRQMGQIQATLANLGLAQANAALQGQKFDFQKEQAAKLTAPEMKLKTETEDLLAQTAQGYQNIKRALELNPNTFDTSLVDTAQRKALEAVGSKDPKVANTRELENMLEKASLSQLKAVFPGAISNDERVALQATQGMAAKSIEERGRIMQNAAGALKGIYSRNKKRLNEINQGAYRATQMPGDE